MNKILQNVRPGIGFKKTNTIDNLFNSYYGFASGLLVVEGKSSKLTVLNDFDYKNCIDRIRCLNRFYVAITNIFKVIEARNLRKTDPFCELKLEKQKFSTEVVSKESEPQWKEEFTFEVCHGMSDYLVLTTPCNTLLGAPVLTVHVYNWKRIGKKVLGEVSISIKDFGDGRIYNQWFKLTDPKSEKQEKHPEIHLRIQYNSIVHRNK